MVKGFSESELGKDKILNDLKQEKKGLFSILREKKFTYTLPGKKQINIFGTLVLGLNLILLFLVILYFNNKEFHDFIFNIGR